MSKRKKYDPNKAGRALVNTYTKKICFIDGAALDEMQVFGTIPPHQSIVNAVSEHLKTRPQDWVFKVFCFCVNQFGEKYERSVTAELKQVTLPELYIEMVDQIETAIETCNHEHYISPGWIAAPTLTADLDGMSDQVIEHFDKAGAYDQLTTSVNMEVRRDKREATETCSAQPQ